MYHSKTNITTSYMDLLATICFKIKSFYTVLMKEMCYYLCIIFFNPCNSLKLIYKYTQYFINATF